MKRRIFFFHTVALVVSLLALLVMCGGTIHLVLRMYQEQAVPAADSRSEQVQAALSSWPEDSWEWWELDRQLGEWNYQLVVEQDHHILYSSLDRFQEELYSRIAADASWPESGTLSLQDQGIYIVGRRCGDVVLVAMMEPAE